MKSRCVTVSILWILFALLISGCIGSGTQSTNTSTNNSSDIRTNPTISPTPIPVNYSVQVDIPNNGPSKLFSLDNISWYEYIITAKLDNETKRLKLVTDYSYYPPYNNTNVCTNWMYEGNGSGYSFHIKDGKHLTGEIRGGLINGQRDLHSIQPPGVVILKFRKLDVSTRFDNTTDSAMKLSGFETVQYKGDLYNCTIYDVSVEGDSFKVWYNASLPLPPKIIANYSEEYFYHRGGGTITGPYTYDLLEWGTNRENIPFYDYPIFMA